MKNIKVIIDQNLKNYGLLKSIPLIKEKYGVSNFTFMAQYYYIFKNTLNPFFLIEDFNINFILLNSSEIEDHVKELNFICQIITQEQEIESKIDITKNLIKYCLNNPKFQLYLITDTVNFKLKKSSMKSRSDRSILDNFNIESVEKYDAILRNYLRTKNLRNLEKYIRFTKNLYFLRIAKLYEEIYGKLKRFEDLFNFRHLREYKDKNSKYIHWKFLSLILEEINKRRNSDDFQLDYFLDNIIKPFIEVDKLRIKNHLDSYFQSIKNNLKILLKDYGG